MRFLMICFFLAALLSSEGVVAQGNGANAPHERAVLFVPRVWTYGTAGVVAISRGDGRQRLFVASRTNSPDPELIQRALVSLAAAQANGSDQESRDHRRTALAAAGRGGDDAGNEAVFAMRIPVGAPRIGVPVEVAAGIAALRTAVPREVEHYGRVASVELLVPGSPMRNNGRF
jgi:hypothetical protein